MERQIFIGDIHGCYEEFQELLVKVNYQKDDDELYLVGDIINRGPSSLKAYLAFKESGAKSILGNHEYFFLKHLFEGNRDKDWVKKIVIEFGDYFEDFVQEIKTWPAYIEKKNFILVHAGLRPDQTLKESKKEEITTIRTWDGIGLNLQDSRNPPWFDFYTGSKLVIFGHWAKLGGVNKENVIGLDTGCVYGNKLSALVLPEREIITVQAKKSYYPVSN